MNCLCGSTSDRTVHFEQSDGELKVSVLGCAILGIIAGIVPEDTDPEILFWAVHAAAGMVHRMEPVHLDKIRISSGSMGQGFGDGFKTCYYSDSFWGREGIFERLLTGHSFAELANSLVKEDQAKWITPKKFEGKQSSLVFYGSYKYSYLYGQSSRYIDISW